MKVGDDGSKIFVVEMGIEESCRGHWITVMTSNIEERDSELVRAIGIGQGVELPSRDVVFFRSQDPAEIDYRGGGRWKLCRSWRGNVN